MTAGGLSGKGDEMRERQLGRKKVYEITYDGDTEDQTDVYRIKDDFDDDYLSYETVYNGFTEAHETFGIAIACCASHITSRGTMTIREIG